MKNYRGTSPINPMTKLSVMKRYLHQIMHVVFLSAVFLIIALSYFDPQLLVLVNQWFSPITGVASLVPYVSLVVHASNTPQITEAYLSLLYVAMAGLFANLYWATRPHFPGAPSKTYEISSNGYAYFMERHIYGRLAPSVSLDRLARQMLIATTRPVIPSEYFSNYRELLIRYFANTEVRRGYIIIFLAGFLGFPWVAYDEVNSIKLSILPFRYAAILMAYCQIRLLFEAVLFLGYFYLSRLKK